MAGIYSQGGSAGHRYAGWLETVEAKNFQFGGKVFNGSPRAIYVGSNLVWANWLTVATVQAILAAFGQRDGKAVIKATNAYLTQLAASDRDKATALAGFINEDPMMVCSLGLEVEGVTMPIRWLVGDGNCWIDSGIVIGTSNFEYQLDIKIGSTISQWKHFVGSQTENNNNRLGVYYGDPRGTRKFGYNAGTAHVDAFTPYQENTEYSIKCTRAKITIGSASANITPGNLEYSIGIFGFNSMGTFGGAILTAKRFTAIVGNMDYELVPFNGRTLGYGMVDIKNATFHPKLGTGQFTIPDISYTPSTP